MKIVTAVPPIFALVASFSIYFAPISVAASPVHWTVDSAFTSVLGEIPQETLVGSFTYDTDTMEISDVSLSITDISSDLELFNYSYGRPFFGFKIAAFFADDPLTVDATGASYLQIGFNLDGTLDYSNSLGSFPITNFVTDPDHVTQASRSECIDENCNILTGVITLSQSGTLTGEAIPAVPVPAAAWLFGAALLGLAGFSRRKST